MSESQADLFQSLEWRECAMAPFGTYDVQAVHLSRKVYIGGGFTRSRQTDSTVLCYDPENNSWKTIKSPAYCSAITTYQDKLVLVGGIEDAVDHATNNIMLRSQHSDTNKLWSLQDDGRWTDELPPMPTPRYGASAVNSGSHLIVAGGYSEQFQQSVLSVVEVFNGRQWTGAESLPKTSYYMKSTLHSGEWYLMGGYRQGRPVFHATVDSLIATAGSPGESEGGSVWKILPEVPLRYSSIAMCGNQLLAIGGGEQLDSSQSAIHRYTLTTDGTPSWVHIGDLPEPVCSTCSIALPSGELLVIGGKKNGGLLSSSVFKNKLRVSDLQESCVMTIVKNSINCSRLPLHLQRMVEEHS